MYLKIWLSENVIGSIFSLAQMFSDFLNWAPIVALYFFCFGGCSFALAYLLKRFTRLDLLECLCGSLALSQLMKLLSMVFSSALNALGSLYIYFYLGSIGLLLLACYLISYKQISFGFFLKASSKIRKAGAKNPIILSLAFLLLGLFLFLLLLRAVYFFDNTYDVVNYGYSKIALLFQNNSIFYLSGLQDLRIDASERNGELYFLHAFLFSSDLRLIGLAGVEVWICIFFGILFLLRQFEVEQISALALALFLSSAPVIFGLSGITKGDAWAIFNFTCATGFLLSSLRYPNFSAARFFFFIVFLTLAATSKMTVAFGVAPMFLYGAVLFLKKKGCKLSLSWLAALFLCGIIAANKQLQNLLVYANPFKRQEWETSVSGFKWENFNGGLPDLLRWVFGLQGDLCLTGWQVDMLKGMGLVFVIILLAVGILLFFDIKLKATTGNIISRPTLIVSVISLVGLFCVISYIPNQMGAFQEHWCRFLTPYSVVLACICLAWISNKARASVGVKYIILLIALAGGFYHLAVALKTSNILSHRGKADMVEKIFNYDRFESRFGKDFQPGDKMKLHYEQNRDRNMNVLAYTLDYDAPYFWIFGDNFAWNVDITDREDKFIDKIKENNYDIICIPIIKKDIDTQNAIDKFERLGIELEPSGDFLLTRFNNGKFNSKK